LRPTTKSRHTQLIRYYVLGETIPARPGRLLKSGKRKPGKPARTVTKHGLGKILIRDITKEQVAAWWRTLPLTQYRRSCDLAYQTLKTVCNTAVEDGMLAENPCKVKGAGKPSKRRDVEPLTPQQVQQVADAMPKRYQLGVLLGAWCALRSGEVRELRRKDIDLDKGTVTVARGVTRANRKTIVGEPKTDAGRRTVRIPESLLPVVKKHLRDNTQLGPEGLLFWNIKGGHVCDAAWRKVFLAACATAGVGRYHFHDLRHTGLTYACIAGATTKELQVMAGHTTAAMVMRYQEIVQDHMSGVVDKLDKIIKTGTKG
jgi:integrase